MPGNRRFLPPAFSKAAPRAGSGDAAIGFWGILNTDNVLLVTLKRLIFTLAAIGVGFLLASGLDLNRLQYSSEYFYGATILLAIGLYGSTSQIFIEAFRANIRIILIAVTLGVLLKVVLIAGFMYLIYRDRNPAYFVLGVAVAQIDPLSVAATRTNSRLTEEGNSVLLAWSSFDDPVTVLLTIYLSVFALSQIGQSGLPGDGFLAGGLSSFGESLLVNILFAVGALLLWKLINLVNARIIRARGDNSRDSSHAPLTPSMNIVAIFVLVILAVIAVMFFLMLGLAIMGLFFRPSLGIASDWLTRVAFLAASVCLGLLLINGVNLATGLALGFGAFVAQIVVAMLITRSLPKPDRGYLAFSQQNGITAIILALLLEPIFPGTAGIVCPAIIVVNLLHGLSTTVWSWFVDRKSTPGDVHKTNPVTSLPPSAVRTAMPSPVIRPAHIAGKPQFAAGPMSGEKKSASDQIGSSQTRSAMPVDGRI